MKFALVFKPGQYVIKATVSNILDKYYEHGVHSMFEYGGDKEAVYLFEVEGGRITETSWNNSGCPIPTPWPNWPIEPENLQDGFQGKLDGWYRMSGLLANPPNKKVRLPDKPLHRQVLPLP